jgi:hypothetical protein
VGRPGLQVGQGDPAGPAESSTAGGPIPPEPLQTALMREPASLSTVPSSGRGTAARPGVPTDVRRTAAGFLHRRTGDTLARVSPPDHGAGAETETETSGGSGGPGLEPGISGPVQPLTSAPPPGPTSGVVTTSTRAGLLEGVQTVEEQLRRLEARLLAEAGGDRAMEQDVRRHLTLARARFASATIRRFLPILIEREVRRRLSGR